MGKPEVFPFYIKIDTRDTRGTGFFHHWRFVWIFDKIILNQAKAITSSSYNYFIFRVTWLWRFPPPQCRNVSSQQQSFSGLQSPRWSFSIKVYYSMLPYFPDTPISGRFDVTILYFVRKTKQIRTICSEDLSTSLLSSVLFAAELRFVLTGRFKFSSR